MTGSAMCISQYKDQLRHHLAIFLRDDLISWQIPEELDDEIEWKKKLRVTVETGVNFFIEKVKAVAPALQVTDKNLFNIPINKKVTELIEQAQDPLNLCQMDPLWQPWI